MKFKGISTVVIAFFIQSAAHGACGDLVTRTFNGDEAVTLTYIFKNSSVASKSTSAGVVTWSLANLQCRQGNRGVFPDLMPTYDCQHPTGIGPITAKSLWDALSELGVFGDGAAGHVFESATNIKCKLNKNGAGGTAINPRCTLTAAWGDMCP